MRQTLDVTIKTPILMPVSSIRESGLDIWPLASNSQINPFLQTFHFHHLSCHPLCHYFLLGLQFKAHQGTHISHLLSSLSPFSFYCSHSHSKAPDTHITFMFSSMIRPQKKSYRFQPHVKTRVVVFITKAVPTKNF